MYLTPECPLAHFNPFILEFSFSIWACIARIAKRCCELGLKVQLWSGIPNAALSVKPVPSHGLISAQFHGKILA